MRSCSLYKVLLMLVCCFPIFQGKLKIQSSKFECGQIATIVCSRTNDNVTGISWFRNDVRTRLCILTVCQFPTEGNYNFSAEGGIWTLTIDPVELKDNNITFACQTPSPGTEAPVRLSSTIDVSVVIDDTSTLTTYESAIDVKLMAMSNCVHPVGNVKITWQCVHAYNVHIIDADCQLDILTTYTSECNDINLPCAGHGTFLKRSVVVLPVYRGECFKWVKVKATFTDGTNIIEKISGRLRQKDVPTVLVTGSNVTVNDASAVLQCTLSRVPKEYTHGDWQHIWPGYGIVQRYNGLGISSTLTLSPLTYEYSGIYNCSVSSTDDIGRNLTVRYGWAFLNVGTFPIIITASPIKYYTMLPRDVTVFVDFYSNRDENNVECFLGTKPIICSSQLLDGDIDLPVFGTTIKTKGTIAKISFTLLRTDHYGTYTIKISNDIGESSLEVNIIPEVIDPADTKPLDTGAIVGGSVGGGVAVLIGVVIILAWITCTRRKVTTSAGNTLAQINQSDTPEKSENTSPQGDTSGIELEVDKGVYYNIERNTYEELHDRQNDIHDYDVAILQNEADAELSTDRGDPYENM